MFHRDTRNILCRTQKQSLHIRICMSVLNHIVPDKFPYNPKARSFQPFWFSNHCPDCPGIDPAADIPVPGMFFLRIICIYNVITLADLIHQLMDLGRMCLQIIIHRNQKVPLCKMESGKHRVMLPGILCQIYDNYIRILPHQRF